jgi:hypothetical protein
MVQDGVGWPALATCSSCNRCSIISGHGHRFRCDR